MRFFTIKGRQLSPESSESSTEESVELVSADAAGAFLEPSSEDLREVERLERGERHLATFLNSALSAMGGFWFGAVPLAWITSGAPLGSFTGFVVSTGALLVALQCFFSAHPWISHNATVRRFGLEIRRRSDGEKRYWVIFPENMPNKERKLFERQLKDERRARELKIAEARRLRESIRKRRELGS